jgi:WD40 repeat protein
VYCVHESLGVFVRDPPLLNPSDRRAFLGSGSFGTLIKAKRSVNINPSGERVYEHLFYALKCINTIYFDAEGGTAKNIPIENIAKEAEILQRLDFPSIVKYIASSHDAANHVFYIVMEFVDGMTLARKVQCNPAPSELEVFIWMKQIAGALSYLHNDMHIIHRDLKPSNVLVSLTGNVIKLCDFGLACDSSIGAQGASRRVGTRNYFSYEKIVGLSYENGCDDMWAAGCILIELLTQQHLKCPLQQPDPQCENGVDSLSWSGWPLERVNLYRNQLLEVAAVVSPLLGGEILPGLLRLFEYDVPADGGGELRHRTTAAELQQFLAAAEPRASEHHTEVRDLTSNITAVQLQRGRDLVREHVEGLLELLASAQKGQQREDGTLRGGPEDEVGGEEGGRQGHFAAQSSIAILHSISDALARFYVVVELPGTSTDVIVSQFDSDVKVLIEIMTCAIRRVILHMRNPAYDACRVCELFAVSLAVMGPLVVQATLLLRHHRIPIRNGNSSDVSRRRLNQLQQRVDRFVALLNLQLASFPLEIEELRRTTELRQEMPVSAAGVAVASSVSIERSALEKILVVYDKALSQKRQDLVYYVPPDVIDRVPESMSAAEYVRKIETQAVPDRAQPLTAAVEEYLRSSNDSVLLLLGDPGAGKSLFSWHGTQPYYQQQRLLQQQTGTCTVLPDTNTLWVPVVIELKYFRMSDIKGLLVRYLTETCGLTEEEVRVLRNHRKPQFRILLVLDGFDELRQESDYSLSLKQAEVTKMFEDCFATACGQRDWYDGQIKLIITCRLRYLADASIEKRFFGHGSENKSYQRRVVLPFNNSKIVSYLEERTSDTAQNYSRLLLASQYIEVMDQSLSVKEMVRNPFVLRLFVEALPELQRQGRDLRGIKRYDIYNAFVTHWFARETARLPIEVRIQIAPTTENTSAEDSFVQYSGILANEMYRQDCLVVNMKSEGENRKRKRTHKNNISAFKIWFELEQRLFLSMDSSLQEEYDSLLPSKRFELRSQGVFDAAAYSRRIQNERLRTVCASLEAFKVTSPLKQHGDANSFIHKSFYEYFLAQSILQSAGSDESLETRMKDTLTCLSSAPDHEARRIQQEPQTLLFLQDVWVGKSIRDPRIELVKQTLFAIIDASKGHPEHGAAAANAITILNWMGTMLMHQSWQDIHIPGANLSYAQMCGSDLTGANLRGVRLFRANLRNVKLVRADLTGTEFLEFAPIKVHAENAEAFPFACAHHPKQPVFAVAIGKEILQYCTSRDDFINKSLVIPTGGANSISYSPNGVLIACCGIDGTIRQWVAATGEPLGHVITQRGVISSIAYSHDGLLLASGSWDCTIRQWVAATGEPFGPVLEGHKDLVNCVAYSPNSLFLVSCSLDHTIRQWVVATGEPFGPVLVGHTSNVRCVAYSADGLLLASGSEDHTIRQWVVATGEPFGPVLVGHTNSVTSVAYSHDGLKLASGSSDCTIRQWVAATGEPFGPVLEGHTREVNFVAYSPHSAQVVSCCDNKTIRQWVIGSGDRYGPVLKGHTDVVYSVAYSSNGLTVASGSLDKTVRQWAVATGEPFGSVLRRHSRLVNCVAYSPTGLMLVSSSKDHTIRQWVAATGETFGPELIAHARYVTSVAYSPDGLILASGSRDHTVLQTVATTGEPMGSVMEGHNDLVTSVTYSPDGLRLASGSRDRTIRQWVAATCESFGSVLNGHTGYVSCVAYSPDGLRLASCSFDSTVRQWVAATGEPLEPVIKGHTLWVNCVTYSPNGLTLASGGGDGTVCQWMAATGEPFGGALQGHTSDVTSVAYSPTGLKLASCGADYRVCVWEATGSCCLLWCTRSARNPLLSVGLQIRDAVGLGADQQALLEYAGYSEANEYK